MMKANGHKPFILCAFKPRQVTIIRVYLKVEGQESRVNVESKKSRVIVESGQMSQEQQSRYIFNKIC